jgi:hypothetical protein
MSAWMLVVFLEVGSLLVWNLSPRSTVWMEVDLTHLLIQLLQWMSRPVRVCFVSLMAVLVRRITRLVAQKPTVTSIRFIVLKIASGW